MMIQVGSTEHQCLVPPILIPHLKDFDLAGGRVEMFCVLFTLVLLERVDLDAERHALFPAVLSHGEFCADAVYLHSKRGRSRINTDDDLKLKCQRQQKRNGSNNY